MTIRGYNVVGAYGGARSYVSNLCDYHANIKRAFSRSVEETGTPVQPDAKCDDCRPAKGPYVLDRVIAEADAKARAAETVPPKVLKGQRRLF